MLTESITNLERLKVMPLEDSIIINTGFNVSDKDAGQGRLSFFELIEVLLNENTALKSQIQLVSEEKASLEGLQRRAELLQAEVDSLQTRLATTEKLLADRDLEVHRLTSRLNARKAYEGYLTDRLQEQENLLTQELAEAIKSLDHFRSHSMAVVEARKNKSHHSHTSKIRDDLISTINGLQLGKIEEEDDSFMEEMRQQVSREYTFDDKTIVDTRVDIDNEILMMSKACENLYARSYPLEDASAATVPASLDRAALEDVALLLDHNNRQKQKHIEEVNRLVSSYDSHVQLPSIDGIFDTIQASIKHIDLDMNKYSERMISADLESPLVNKRPQHRSEMKIKMRGDSDDQLLRENNKKNARSMSRAEEDIHECKEDELTRLKFTSQTSLHMAHDLIRTVEANLLPTINTVEDEKLDNEIFGDYEPKALTIKDNLSYASSMTPKNFPSILPLTSSNLQRRQETRNIPMDGVDQSKKPNNLTKKYQSRPHDRAANTTDQAADMQPPAFSKFISEPLDLKRDKSDKLYLIPEKPEELNRVSSLTYEPISRDDESPDEIETATQKDNIQLFPSDNDRHILLDSMISESNPSPGKVFQQPIRESIFTKKPIIKAKPKPKLIHFSQPPTLSSNYTIAEEPSGKLSSEPPQQDTRLSADHHHQDFEEPLIPTFEALLPDPLGLDAQQPKQASSSRDLADDSQQQQFHMLRDSFGVVSSPDPLEVLCSSKDADSSLQDPPKLQVLPADEPLPPQQARPEQPHSNSTPLSDEDLHIDENPWSAKEQPPKESAEIISPRFGHHIGLPKKPKVLAKIMTFGEDEVKGLETPKRSPQTDREVLKVLPVAPEEPAEKKPLKKIFKQTKLTKK